MVLELDWKSKAVLVVLRMGILEFMELGDRKVVCAYGHIMFIMYVRACSRTNTPSSGRDMPPERLQCNSMPIFISIQRECESSAGFELAAQVIINTITFI
jgi:hypothetical protein